MSTSAALAPAGTPSIEGKYLTVLIATEAYGIAIVKVREIIRLQKITTVPQMPEHVRGVINLRGRVIPIIDLRMKFGLKADYAERTCIVVVQVLLANATAAQMGLIVDSVEEVITLAANQIEPTPDFGVQIDTAYLLGMAKVNGQVKTLLDIDRVVGADTLRSLAASVGGVPKEAAAA